MSGLRARFFLQSLSVVWEYSYLGATGSTCTWGQQGALVPGGNREYVYTVHDYTIILLRTRILVGETGFDPKTIVFVLYVSGSGLKCLTRI